MTDRTPDPLVAAITERLAACIELDTPEGDRGRAIGRTGRQVLHGCACPHEDEHDRETPPRLCPEAEWASCICFNQACDIAAAVVGVVVLKTDLRQVGHLTKNGWLIENSHDDPGFALTHDAAPVFVLVEPEVTA